MRTRDVVGKCIKKVDHTRWYNEHLKRMETTVLRIWLEDDSVLYPFAFEAEDGPGATIGYAKNKRQRKED